MGWEIIKWIGVAILVLTVIATVIIPFLLELFDLHIGEIFRDGGKRDGGDSSRRRNGKR